MHEMLWLKGPFIPTKDVDGVKVLEDSNDIKVQYDKKEKHFNF